jgi:hypothetical protein
VRLSSDATFCALRVELQPLDLQRLRVRVLAQLPRLADRRRFEREAEGASHAHLVDLGARAIVRSLLLASYRAGEGDRVSGEHAVHGQPVARVRLVRRTG